PRAADRRAERELADRLKESYRLGGVTALPFLQAHAAAAHRILDRAHDQALAQLGRSPVAEVGDLGEVVPGVDMHQREREAPRAECLLRETQQHGGVLAAREE